MIPKNIKPPDFDFHQQVERNDIDTLLLNNDDNDHNVYLVPLSIEDHNILENILNSKLLFVEDACHVEVLLSNTYCCSTFKDYICCVAAGIVAGGLSSIMLLKKCVNISFCVPLTIATSYFVHRIYKGYKSSDGHFLNMYITNLQKLCSSVHKVLRFIKEMEIISTDQVSSNNICAATYINPKKRSMEELNELPRWKTLPKKRKCLARALVDIISLFSTMSKNVQLNAPVWAKEYLSPGIYVQNIFESFCKINQSIDCVSIKDLQTLLDTYLVIQSEFLRFIAFSFCPINRESCFNNQYKYYVLKLLKESDLKLLVIYSQLKMLYNIESIFENTVIPQQPSNGKMKVLNTLQVNIHSLFIRLTSLVMKSKHFEDQIEDLINFNNNTNNVDLKNTIANQMLNLKQDITFLMKSYDDIYNEITLQTNKSHNNSTVNAKKASDEEDNMQLQVIKLDRPPREHVLPYNSTDEIFIAKSDQKDCVYDSYLDNWSQEIKPSVPKNMLSELSSTLKPIKENFKKREKLALERHGLQDIESDDETDENGSVECLFTCDKINKNVEENNCSSSPDGFNVSAREMEEESYPPGPVFNSSLLANMAAKKSQLWITSSEEHFYDG